MNVAEYMTAEPKTLRAGSSLAEAYRLLREHSIRHLPIVEDGGELMGLLSDRQVFLARRERGIDPEDVLVDEIMAREPYAVSPDTPIEEAAATMAERRFGSVVVVQARKVVGILTTTDLLRAFVDLRRERDRELGVQP